LLLFVGDSKFMSPIVIGVQYYCNTIVRLNSPLIGMIEGDGDAQAIRNLHSRCSDRVWPWRVGESGRWGQLNIVEHAVRHLRNAHPAMPYARNLCGIFDRIPDPTQARFEDDASKDVQVIARNSDAVILLQSARLSTLPTCCARAGRSRVGASDCTPCK
jgi:hypothetical protein